jgi:hypothetical protein
VRYDTINSRSHSSASLDLSLYILLLYLSIVNHFILTLNMSDLVHVQSVLDTNANADADEDLRDVFRLMYDDQEDWADFDEVRYAFEWMVTVTDC